MRLSTLRAATLGVLLAAGTGAAAAVETYDLGGSAKGDPSVVWYKFAGADAVAVFVRGTDGHMYAQVGDGQGAGWTGWAPIGDLTLKGDPACVATTTSLIDCVAVGAKNNVYHVSYNAKKHTWTEWENIGGFATGNPGIARTIDEDGNLLLNVFVSGPNNQLFLNARADGEWTDWQNLEITVSGTVACTDILVLGAHCYDTGDGSAVQYSDLTRNSGSAVFVDKLGGAITGKVSAVATGKAGDTLRIFVNGPGHRLWMKKWHGSWNDWVEIVTTVLSAPGCAIRQGGGYAWCAGIEPDGTVKMMLIPAAEM